MKKALWGWVLGFGVLGFEGGFVVLKQEGRRGRKDLEGWVEPALTTIWGFNPKIRFHVFVRRGF